MILILITYTYVIFISVGYGLIFKKWIDFKKKNIIFTILPGLFAQLIFSTFYALFLPLNFYFYLLNTIISISLYVNSFPLALDLLKNVKKTFHSFSRETKFIFLSTSFLTLLHSSSLPFITDNESYYIQTIKWLNNYGLIKGIANLHLFLGQFSGWHILQSSFNLGFLPFYGNDLNGFLLVSVGFYASEKWQCYSSSRNRKDLFVSLFFIFWIFLIFFIPSPSPDLPIIVIVPIVVLLFIDSYYQSDSSNLILIFILTLLAVIIKVTIIPILIIPFLFLIRNIKTKSIFVIVSISFLAFLSLGLKNVVISGYPFYPLSVGADILNVDWKTNFDIHESYFRQLKMTGFQLFNWEDFIQRNSIEKFLIWFNLPGMKGVMNKIIILSVILFPIICRRLKSIKFLSLYVVLQFVYFFSSSPQYRFFLPILLTIGMFISTELLHQRYKLIRSLMVVNLILTAYLGFFGFNFSIIATNRIMDEKKAFKLSQILIPRPISQFENLEFKKCKIGNLEYYSPVRDSLFFWQTSDGPLPCANREMIEYFSLYFNHIPQLRSENLNDGFKSSNPQKIRNYKHE